MFLPFQVMFLLTQGTLWKRGAILFSHPPSIELCSHPGKTPSGHDSLLHTSATQTTMLSFSPFPPPSVSSWAARNFLKRTGIISTSLLGNTYSENCEGPTTTNIEPRKKEAMKLFLFLFFFFTPSRLIDKVTQKDSAFPVINSNKRKQFEHILLLYPDFVRQIVFEIVRKQILLEKAGKNWKKLEKAENLFTFSFNFIPACFSRIG